MAKIVRVLPEAEDFLYTLPSVLGREGYKSTFEGALRYVDAILDFISRLPHVPHYAIPEEFEYHFKRYGSDLRYAFFKQKASSTTTWYIFIEETEDYLLVTHISNNWLEGHYLR